VKKTVTIICLISIALCCAYGTTLGNDNDADATRMMLTPETIPPGMKIAQEVWASKKQLLQTRLRVGFPLNALLNQLIVYETEQAQVNYLVPPGRDWLEFGYSKLVNLDGKRSLIMTNGDVIEQVAATSEGMENVMVRLLDPDPIHQHKIRGHRLPKDWTLVNERLLEAEELGQYERMIGRPLRCGVLQEFVFGRELVRVWYYECNSGYAAEELARYLAGMEHSLYYRLVEWSGPIVAEVESQNERINEDAMSLVNW
jgi:hypothetical protein